MSRALYVGVEAGSHLYLPHAGYARVLRRFNWDVDEIPLLVSAEVDVRDYDLILWNGLIPESVLRRIRPTQQILVAMNGAGDDLTHYARYAERIALATTSLAYFDETRTAIHRRYISPRRMASRQYLQMTRTLGDSIDTRVPHSGARPMSASSTCPSPPTRTSSVRQVCRRNWFGHLSGSCANDRLSSG